MYHIIKAAQSVLQGEYILLEAIASPTHKAMATKASQSSKDSTGLTKAERISKDVMSTDRITIPLERTVTPSKRVIAHLQRHGYSVDDYAAGIAYHKDTPTRKTRIGKILASTDADQSLKTTYEKDPARQGIKTDGTSIVISRRPHDVAGMSSHQNWESCQTLGGSTKIKGEDGEEETVTQKKGSQTQYVPTAIASGAHIAYLVKNPDDVDKHYKPIARMSLNPYVSATSKHTILRPSGENYGDNWEGFHHSLNKWSEKNFPAKDPEYHRADGVYPEGESRIRNFAPEHDEYWKNQHDDGHAQKHHPSPDVLNHFVDKGIESGHAQRLSNILTNPNLPESAHEKIVNHTLSLPNSNPGNRHAKNMIAEKTTKPEYIQRILDKNMDSSEIYSHASKNPHATKEQLHQIMDTHGFGQTSNPNIRKESGYRSTDIVKNIALHPNADDEHFRKILQLDNFNSDNENHKLSSTIDHQDALEAIGRKYHSEDIGKSLTNLVPQTQGGHFHSIVHDIAQKHPHLLSGMSDDTIQESYRRHPMNRNLETEALKRNTIPILRTVANNTSDHQLLDALKNHPDSMVSSNATFRKKVLEA